MNFTIECYNLLTVIRPKLWVHTLPSVYGKYGTKFIIWKKLWLHIFEMVKLVKRNVLVESKGFAFLEDVGAQPPCRMISCPKFRCEVTAWYDWSQWHDFGDTRVVAERASDRVELGISIGCMEWVEPLNTSVVSREIVTMQVIWKGKNKSHLSNMESYQAARWKKKKNGLENKTESSFKWKIPSK